MTAETAMVLPVLGLVAVLLGCVVLVAVAQVRVVDAAREAARLAARGEATSVVQTAVARSAPPGSRVNLGTDDEHDVTASVTCAWGVPGPLGRLLPALKLHAEATAAREAR